MSEAEEVEVKKVKPYPIKCRFEGSGEVFYGNIVKLGLHGFLVELNEVVVRVQQKFLAEFETTVLGDLISGTVIVVKTYDKYKNTTNTPFDKQGKPIPVEDGSVAVRIAEFHFKSLVGQQREKIKQFLVAIGQVPR